MKDPRSGEHQPCRLGICDGSGWILGPEDVARPCECRSQMVAKARLRGIDSVIPAKYRGVSFDRPPVTQIDELVVQQVRRYCDALEENLDAGRGLWFLGSHGTGKTTLAMIVAAELGADVALDLPVHLQRTLADDLETLADDPEVVADHRFRPRLRRTWALALLLHWAAAGIAVGLDRLERLRLGLRATREHEFPRGLAINV